MQETYRTILGIAGTIFLAISVFVVRSLNGRMASIEKKEEAKVDKEFCDERYGHVAVDIKETKECLVAIKERLNAIEVNIAAWPSKEAIENLLKKLESR